MRKPSFTTLMLVAGLVFLYLPMIILVIYSFNSSRLVTVWAGFSAHWYVELFRDRQILSAIWTSLRIAFFSASMAVCLGTLAAFVMVRFTRFRGKTALSSMVTAPLVMPEVITGLSLLLLFVHMAQLIGWPADRGMITIWIAHTTFCSAYVAVVVASRLREVDLSIEEAAMDLGARPVRTFFQITLPVIAPALAAGWLLAFTLSLDDLVIASFVSGPGATTLPMVVFSSVRLGVSPKINALATLIILAVSLATFIAWYLMRRSEARRKQAMLQDMTAGR
ncbi:ABC transporter permease subunit [Billgrantia sp. LNSP4103-1]|uniref:ABC transporter permease subunit n=1 Tax=Billgrantia sp. LNSP4103-1 TaxID=3410266 RepID=UPI00403F8E29